jgi:dTDP-4-dehydro-6-deoxy-alpha-D-glucopyranose 2,3-dehydratase
MKGGVTMTTHKMLKARHDRELMRLLARSAEVTEDGASMRTEECLGWIAGFKEMFQFRVDRIPLAKLDGWAFDQTTGNLFHQSGKFFSVEGIDVVSNDPDSRWRQPILVQPEAAILGIIAKEFDGILHFLLQAKMEPGNPGLVQLSPTVQATPSNYTRVHRGGEVSYIDYFIESGRCNILVDVLQSELGYWFWRKANRNMIVAVTEDVPLRPEFCWLTLGQIGALLRRDNTINMDTRSILSCAPLPLDSAEALHPDIEVMSWFTAARARRDLRAQRIPLAQVPDWTRGDWSIEHIGKRHFRIVGVAVEAANREVPRWSQPLCEPIGPGVHAFLMCRFEGVPHLLARVSAEPGFVDTVELGPTVQYMPAADEILPPFADVVSDAPLSSVVYEARHAEEGGRFLNAESTYQIIEIEAATAPTNLPPAFCWVTPGQLASLTRHGHYVNVQARTLLAALSTGVTL